MKAQFLKLAGVKSEKEFYKKYPTEEAFFAAHPEAQMMMKTGGETDPDEVLSNAAKKAFSFLGDMVSAPARLVVKGLTGKYQDPSEAMGITNPVGAFLTDAVLDPTNLVGAGLAAKVLKGTGKAGKVVKSAGTIGRIGDAADHLVNRESLKMMKTIGPRNIPIDPASYHKAANATVDALTQRGQQLDRVTGGKLNLSADDINYHGTYDGRPIVEVQTPHGPEYFYKSTGWAQKSQGKVPGQWQAFGQFMDAPAGTLTANPVNNWFVKGHEYKNFYGSKTFKNTAEQLDNLIMQKYGVPQNDLNKFLNFQNVQGDVNTFTPQRKEGGEMIKRADGSYSKRGLWDNIRANKGSGKKPTREMLEQERKIKAEMKGGGTTYSGGLWYDVGGTTNPWMVQSPTDDTEAQANADMQITGQMDPGSVTNLSGAANAVFANQLQTRVAKDNPSLKTPPMTNLQKFNFKTGAVYNAMADQMVNPYSLTNMLRMGNDVIEGFQNRQDYEAKHDKQRMSYSSDQAFKETTPGVGSRGNYDMYNTFRPNQIGGNMSYSGMNQPYFIPKAFAEGGQYDVSNRSWVPSELEMPTDIPFFVAAPKANTFEMTPSKSASPEVENVTRMNFNLSGNFETYAAKAQKYLDKVAPGTDVRGADLAAAAQQAYQKHGEVVPVELALAQLTQEGYLAKGKKQNKPQRTKNPFNVGNTDSGATVAHNNVYDGIMSYYNLMASSYLKKRTPQELLQNFVNGSGNRYASDRKYEASLRNIISNMKLQQGGEYELTEDQIMHIRAMGGEVEFI